MKVRHTIFFLLLMLLFVLKTDTICAEQTDLHLLKNDQGKYGIEIRDKDNKLLARQSFPVVLTISSGQDKETTIQTGYDVVKQTETGFLCHALVSSENGSRFEYQDEIITGEEGLFRVQREVTVSGSDPKDKGFSSRIAISMMAEDTRLDAYDLFAPGIIYKTNTYNNNGPANPDLTSKGFSFRETRFGLPMFFVRNPGNEISLSLAHVSPQIESATLRYGSIGVSVSEKQAANTIEIDYTYPSADSRDKKNHPVAEGFSQRYEVSIYVSKNKHYTAAATEAYKKHFNLYDIDFFKVDIQDVYKAQLDMFEQLAAPINDGDAFGIPWSLSVPEGQPHAFELQNGFVGQQTSIAYQLMRYGLEQKREDIFDKGLAMADFWFSDEQLVQHGLPRSWWIQGTKEDGYGNKYTGTFWSYPAFIRCATDGMEGLLDCVRLARAYHLPQEKEWMEILSLFGEFLLVKAESAGDGSFYRAYDHTGHYVRDPQVMGPAKREQNKLQADSKTNTLIPVRFLVRMYELTNDKRYYTRALAAGEYGYKTFFRDLGLFIGGTPDHANVCDKEAGVYAMYAFTSLYQLTHDKKWLTAAEYAAIFAFSHTYCYDFRIEGDEKENIFRDGGVIGHSIISVGTSDSDNYNAFIYYELFKMFVLTEDPFYKKAAKLLEKNTKKIMDIDGTKGYAYRALLLEASTFCNFTFSSVKAWLPWCGVANSDPIIKFYQTFGAYNISDIENKTIEALKDQLTQIGAGGKEYHIWK